MSLQEAPDHLVLAVDLIELLEDNPIPAQTVLAALAVVRRDFERKLKVEVPNGRQFRLVLDDGSEVWLNAGSKLEYPATFENASERRVRIEGEAFFEIKRDTCCPFCVELGDGECIRVLGTSFNVNAYAGNGRHVTTLVTGRIGYAASAGAEEVVLEPNQQVSRDLAAGTVAVSAVDGRPWADSR